MTRSRAALLVIIAAARETLRRWERDAFTRRWEIAQGNAGHAAQSSLDRLERDIDKLRSALGAYEKK